jgi:hypothetical protein
MNWQPILWELRRNYKNVASIAREVEYCSKTLQKLANGTRRHDLPYAVGNKLIELHKTYCENKIIM